MNGVTFATPLGLLALLALVPLLLAWLVEARGERRVDRVYGGSPALRVGRSRARRILRRVLLVGAIVCAAAAIARPQWGTTKSPVQRQGIDLVIALDISRSMQAADVKPTRAAAAAAGLTEMLRHLGGDRVGLVTFAGTAFARSPLTLDAEAVADLVSRAQREGALVGPGTDVGAAINSALRLLDVPDRAATRAIVLISDGEDLGTVRTDAVEAARRAGVRIYTVAAGTEAGALVPAGDGTTRPGAPTPSNEVVSRADRAALARIAADTGGGTRDVTNLAGLAVDLARLQQSELDRNTQDVPIERFQWPLGAAIALLLAHTLIAEASAERRRTASTSDGRGARRALGVAGLIASLSVVACSGTEAYQRVHEGNTEYARERYQQALAAYARAKQIAADNPIVDYDISNTMFRLDRFEDAQNAAKTAATSTKDGALFAQATYAAASAAYRRGNLNEARDGFITVLQRDPNDADARHNLEVVLHAIQRGATPTPTPTPSPTPPPGGGASASPTPGGQQGGGAQPGGTPATGQPGGQPGQQGQPGPGGAGPAQQPGATGPEAERAADEALRRALEGLPAELTPEQALAVLDAARAASEAGTLQRAPGNGPDPNDR